LNPQRHEFDDALEAFLDGGRPPEERAALVRALGDEAEIRAAETAQTALDEALGRVYRPTPADEVLRALGLAAAAQPAPRRLLRRAPAWLAAAAAFGLLALGIAYFGVRSGGSSEGWRMSIAEVYDLHVARDLDPNRVCTDPQAFAGGVWRKTGQGLLLVDPLPDDVRMTGFARGKAFGRNVLLVLCRVEGKPVVVFLLPRHVADREATRVSREGLNVFRRDVGDAAILEVTPLDAPRVLDLLYDPRKPVEWYQNAPW